MSAVVFEKRTAPPLRRVYLRTYPQSRWRYWHVGLHDCFTKRADGRNRFLWLALGPVDIRVHF